MLLCPLKCTSVELLKLPLTCAYKSQLSPSPNKLTQSLPLFSTLQPSATAFAPITVTLDNSGSAYVHTVAFDYESMPPKSSFLSKFSKQTSYEIVETPSQDPKRPSSWHYRKVSASSEPAPRKPSSVLDFVPEDSYTAQAKSEELHDLFQEVEQLYSAEKYSNVAFDDLPVVKPAPPGKTPSPLNRYIISRLASPKPANVKADETSLFKLPFLGEVRTLTSEKSSPTKALQRRNARQTPPPKGPETPAPLNLFPRNTPPRKPVPPNPRLGCGRAKDLEKPVLVSSLQSKSMCFLFEYRYCLLAFCS